MADSINPNKKRSFDFLPRVYRTDTNKKFTQATVDQLIQPGQVKKVNGFVGRQNAKASSGSDIFIEAVNKMRQDYQLEPSLEVNDKLGNTTFFKDYQDYINQLEVFGSNISNQARINKQEFYSWDPHIDWDKFVNFQNYYWLPYGADLIRIAGQQQEITSTYTVSVESELDSYEYLFTPNGLTRNPTLTLYKGQTYKFDITAPGNPFSIKTSRIDGTLDRYDAYGLTGVAVENGTITFTVPQNAPDILYYVSETDVNVGGVFHVKSIEENTKIDVAEEIIGKKTYTLPNGTTLSNGMKVSFIGKVTPEQYATGEYYVEGVGSSIVLIKETDLALLSVYTNSESILFDTTPFDGMPFGDATSFSKIADYITINRASLDRNPWTRYNRWIHKDVIEASASFNNKVPDYDQSARAIRPIIEFEAGLRLFNYGLQSPSDVDLIDNFTTDVFSTIEGSAGYNVDNVQLANGHRVLFTADTDPFVKNKIFRVEFIDVRHESGGSRQIHLVLDSDPFEDEVVVIRQGVKSAGNAYWYDGTSWILGQQKTAINQPPLFDIIDDNKVSLGNKGTYEGSTFAGTKLFSYKVGSGTADKTLGFALSYKNINNIGDIVFNFNILTDTFQYRNVADIIVNNTSTGYLTKISPETKLVSYANGWKKSKATTVQPALRIYKNSNKVNNFDLDIFDDKNDLSDLVVRVYINGIRLDKSLWSVVNGAVYKKVVLTTDISLTDVLTIKAFAKQPINKNGHYEVPINLQNNPLNGTMADFTLGEIIDHVNSIVDNLELFSGSYPGPSNLRDLGDTTSYGTKFVQHSGPLGLSLYHITSQTNNVIRAIELSKDDYGKFKRSFISVIENIETHYTDAVAYVDVILEELNKDKPKSSPYYFSDMVAYGAKVHNDYTVIDYRIKTYPLSNTFDLTTLSNKAVHVYHNSEHLLYGRDYSFSDQGFVVISDSVNLQDDDTISIDEYDNTDGCFVPQTPTKLGIWPKFEPKIYLDTSLITPRTMIQGHDGSQILAYEDYRDDLILELEKRIYNNIKVEYNPEIFDIYDIIPSYVRDLDYSLEEFNQTLAPQFYKWTGLIDRDFSKPLSFDRNNPMTFNYTGHTAPDGRETPGYWRGIYRWMLDTDRPNLCPWEMLGFSEEPTWWTSVYGQAPYTSDNLPLWQDLSEGLVREPNKPVVKLEKFVRPFLADNIPVDEFGNIASPLASNLSRGTITQATGGDFVFGDVSPIEAAWRRSSYYPFSVLLTSMLLQPAKTFGTLLDRSQIVRNLTGQLVYKKTGLRITPADVVLPSIYSDDTRVQTAGIINYIVDYILNDNLKSYDQYAYDLQHLTAKISYRVGGFTSKEKFNLLLDSKSPTSTGSVFVPQEDYKIVLNVSSPIKKITYSGVIVTKLSDGYEVKGYSKTQPYFKYYPWLKSGPTVNVGGISESFSVWTAGQQYAPGKVVVYSNRYYRVKTLHTTTATFDATFYETLPALPIIGGREAVFRVLWDTTSEIVVPYGTKFADIQEVVDFLLGYGEWLKDQGFIFDDFNNTMNTITNWETSAKEFLFWTTQNWSSGQDKWDDWLPNVATEYQSIVKYNGDFYQAIHRSPPSPVFIEEDFIKLDGLSTVGSSVISLSPAAGKLTFATPYSVVDDIKGDFNPYELFKVDGTPLSPNLLNSYREENEVSYASASDDGIFGATFYLVQKEQVVILNNSTMFNDTIYNPESGYRQERITVSGYVSTDWNGSFEAPGFVFDRAEISDWAEWEDYALGDIVRYKEFFYSANKFIPGALTFDPTDWIKLDKKPSAKLLPNWSYKAEQFNDFYSLDSDNFDVGQQKMAQHLIGYQKRQYLENIIKDDVSEFKFYQGMIIEKGTQNVLNKLFDVLSADGEESLKFHEEWAVRVGQYGANAAFENIEFILDQNLFKNNPQGFKLVNEADRNVLDFIIRQTPNDVYLKPLGYNNNPWPTVSNYIPYLRTPGYVRPNEVSLVLNNIGDITSKTVDSLKNGQYVWCGFEGREWNVYKYSPLLVAVTDASYSDTDKELTISLAELAKLSEGTYVGIEGTAFDGFYKVKNSILKDVVLEANIPTWSAFVAGTQVNVYVLKSQRAESIDTADTLFTPALSKNDLLWTDDSGDGKWATWSYAPVYTSSTVKSFRPIDNLEFGRHISLSNDGTIAAVSTVNGSIYIYNKLTPGLPWTPRQEIVKPFISSTSVVNNWVSTAIYGGGEVVFYQNAFYEAIDSSSDREPSSNTQQWKQIYFSDVSALSADGTWLAVASPTASFASTHNYAGEWDMFTAYSVDDIVSYNGKLYTSLEDNNQDQDPSGDKTIFWKPVGLISVNKSGTDSEFVEQGVVSIYKKDVNGFYSSVATFVSPVADNYEHFGATLAFGGDILLVGAPGSGTLYKIDYKTTIYATALFNQQGGTGTTIKVTSTVGVEPGMEVYGTGFTSGQTVVETYKSDIVGSIALEGGKPILTVTTAGSVNIEPGFTITGVGIIPTTVIRQTSSSENDSLPGLKGKYLLSISTLVASGTLTVNSTFVKLSAAPDTTPEGRLQFGITGWEYNSIDGFSDKGDPEENYGSAIALSSDSSTLVVSSDHTPYTTPFDTLYQGKVYVYKNNNGTFELAQEITSPTLDDQFGHSITVSDSGEYIGVSSPLYDSKKTDQGGVVIYKYNSSTEEYEVYQSLTNVRPEQDGAFGTKIAFMNNYKSIVVYSAGADVYVPETFDSNTTIFDDNLTSFAERHVDSGRVDVYDMYATKWAFSESLPTTSVKADGYGTSVAIGANHVFIGAPFALSGTRNSGIIYEYSKFENRYSWEILHKEIEKLDLTKIKSAFLYNRKTNKLISYIDVIDSVQGRIPGVAEQELKYKTFYDPATYSVGTSSVNVDDGMAWTKMQVGQLWWDLRTAKFNDSHDNDPVYRNSTWNTLFSGASIDVYEWVESKLKPSAWDELSDTETGIVDGISGTSLYGDAVYSVDVKYDNISKSKKYTYYYWVKNKKVVPNVINRHVSAQDVANLISNPRGNGYKYLALTGTDSFSLVNVSTLLEDRDVVLSVQYWTADHKNQNIHSEWKLLSTATGTVIPATIEDKWFDSLCGKDSQGRIVPDPTLPPKLRYGIENRPRQSMFVNRFEALKQLFEKLNIVLMQTQIVGNADLSILDSFDAEPSVISGLYDSVFDTDAELRFANIGKFKQAELSPVITNGRITSVNIVSKGNGYINAPSVTISDTGIGAKLKTVINVKGQVVDVVIENAGYGYTDDTVILVRRYTVLVHYDSQAVGAWSLYSYDQNSLTWDRVKSQSYDTRNYWEYADWYATGFSQFTAADYSVETFSELSLIAPPVGKVVKVRTTTAGGWVLLRKYAESTSIDWTQSYEVVGQQSGTIQFKQSLYNIAGSIYGYDGSLFDDGMFDSSATVELRNILSCIKNNILIDELRHWYLELFFISVRYAFVEQNYLDWIFKTSFVKAQHNVGPLHQPSTYRNDSLQDFESYIAEVKPYRTKVREYVSAYSSTDTSQLSMTDFDLQPIYEDNKIKTIKTSVSNGTIISDSDATSTYPWKHWLDNVGFAITDIKITDNGLNYHMEPVVHIVGDCTEQATAKAFITNGKVSRILLTYPGKGYLKAPTIIIDGGLKENGVNATAVAIIGNSVVRSSLVKMKFDRITQTYYITQLEESEAFVGTGSRLQWPLKWAPDVRIGKSTVLVNGVDVLRDDYKLITVKSTARGYTSYSGSIVFKKAIAKNATVEISYLKDWSLLNAADRIQYYYNPESGQLGKDLSQLMTGVDYGGVIIDGLGLTVNEGWDSAPFLSDKWDSFDIDTFDDAFFGINQSTIDNDEAHTFKLKYIPEDGMAINIYYIKLYSVSYVADGNTIDYKFDPQFYSSTAIAAELPTVVVSKVVNSSGSNLAGSSTLIVDSTAGLLAGDVLSVNVDGIISLDTTILSIVDGTTLKLNSIIYGNIADATPITFSRTLVNGIDYIINFTALITLKDPVDAGNTITISAKLEPLRLDDPYFDAYDGEILQPNGRKTAPLGTIVNTQYGDGETDTWTIPSTFEVSVGDLFILRKYTSDGSIAPQDYDTSLTGGNLSYSSATGLSAEDIIVDGDGFVTETSSPATEELVPGQIFDTVAIKVYDQPQSGSASIKVDNYIADGSVDTFKLTQRPNSATAILIKVDSAIITIGDDYTVNYETNEVVLVEMPTAGQLVSIFSFGFSGSNILDLDFFVGNGQTSEFLTRAPWLSQITGLVYIDGLPANVEFFETDSSYDSDQRTGIRFLSAPSAGAIINYVIVSGPEQTFSITKTERIATDNRSAEVPYILENKIGDSQPVEASMIVRVDQQILTATNNVYFTIGGKNKKQLTYVIDSNVFAPYSVDINDIVLYVGNKILTLGTDYIVDLSVINVKVTTHVRDLYLGQTLVINVVPNRLTTGPSYTYLPGVNNSTPRILFSEQYDSSKLVEVVSFYKHDVLDIQRTNINITTSSNYTPDTIEYYNFVAPTSGNIKLSRAVASDEYVWVMQNDTLLTPSVDYKLNSDKQSITLAVEPLVDDVFTLMTYGSNIIKSGISYMQFKDMLNRTHFKRLSLKKQTRLTADLKYNDLYVEVEDASTFDAPSVERNKPGIIEIRGERIEFFTVELVGSTYKLGQLRRGTLGTGIPSLHKVGSYVQELGPSETLPYKDVVKVEQIVSEGTNIVPLTFVPTRVDIDNWFTTDGYTLIGDYSNAQTYSLNDVVAYNSSYYTLTQVYALPATFVVLSTSADDNMITCSSTSTISVGSSVLLSAGIANLQANVIYYVKSVDKVNNKFTVSETVDGNVLSLVGEELFAKSIGKGIDYTISTIGNTDFTLIGASSNTVGLTFTADWGGIPNPLGVDSTGTVISANAYSQVNARVVILPTNDNYWSLYDTTIPAEYGQSNDIEVFVGGYAINSEWGYGVNYSVGSVVTVGSYTYRCITEHTSTASIVNGVAKTFFDDIANWKFFVGNIRLKKSPYYVHNVNVHSESPEGDIRLDAEFTVDGVSKELRLTTPLAFGTRVTVVKKTASGELWDSASSIFTDTGKVASFLKAEPGIWYTNIGKYD